MRVGRRARSRRLWLAPLRMRSGTQMALSIAGGGAWFASGRITLGKERRHDASGRRPFRRNRNSGSRLGNDFYSTPRLSPDGSRMSWLTWRHPDMPWVATEAWVGEILPDWTIVNPRRVAGGPDESVFQPEWSPQGDLYFVSDRDSGWWNLYRERDGAIEPMAEMDAEFGRPQWQFGMSTYTFEVRRSPDLMLRPRWRLDAGWYRYAVQALRGHSDRIY